MERQIKKIKMKALNFKLIILLIVPFLTLLVLASAERAFAVITVAFDASASSKSNSANSLTFSHTTGTGSDRILIVSVGIQFPGTTTINSVTYNAIALTRLSANVKATIAVEMWYLIAPPSGAHNVVISLSGATAVTGGSQSFNNVDPSSPFGTTVSNSGNGTTASVVVSSAVNQMVVDAVITAFNAVTVGAGQTQNYNQATTNNKGAGSMEAGAASVTMSWTFTNDTWALTASPLKPATVLPISLYSFNAVCKDEKMNISWITVYEINSQFFTLERSVNGEFFEEVTVVDAAGNINTPKDYHVIDTAAYEGTSYYRLKQTDYNGAVEYFPVITATKCNSKQLSLQAYFAADSPSNTPMLIYQLPQPGKVTIRVFNMSGELVQYSEIIQSEHGIYNYAPFPNGLNHKGVNYIAQFQYDNQITTCRFIQ
jgi:hypothetical protein